MQTMSKEKECDVKVDERMNAEERDGLIKFCMIARAEIEGIDVADIQADNFVQMSDEELKQEADWLDELLGK